MRIVYYGTQYTKAKKSTHERYDCTYNMLTGAELTKELVGRYWTLRTMMLTASYRPFLNKLSNCQVTTIIITKESAKCPQKMSSHEVNQAVQHIQVAPPTNELAELQAFIEAQNIAAGTSNNKNKSVRVQICLDQSMIKFPDPAGNATSNAQNSAPNPTTTTENPGYSTHSNMVIREPVQYQYIYDPINDVMKRVEKTAGGCLEDVGKGKQCTSYSAGKQKLKAKVMYNYYSIFLSRTLSGTESSNTTATSTQRQSHKDGNSIQSNPCVQSANTPANSVSTSSDNSTITTSGGYNNSTVNEASAVLSVNRPDTSTGDELSCGFSSEEDTREGSNPVKEKPISSERHAQIDARI